MLDILSTLCFVGVSVALYFVYKSMNNLMKALPMGPFQKIRKNFAKQYSILMSSFVLMTICLIGIDSTVCYLDSYFVILLLSFLQLFPICCILNLHNKQIPEQLDEQEKEVQPSGGFLKAPLTKNTMVS